MSDILNVIISVSMLGVLRGIECSSLRRAIEAVMMLLLSGGQEVILQAVRGIKTARFKTLSTSWESEKDG